MYDVTILDTMEMVTGFEHALGYSISPEDKLQVFRQLFYILDECTPLDMYDRKILSYDELLFANHLNVDHDAVDKIAYHLLVHLWQLLQDRGLYSDGRLMYIPYSIQGWDLCVHRCKN
jgi:hypothetical protein